MKRKTKMKNHPGFIQENKNVKKLQKLNIQKKKSYKNKTIETSLESIKK